ncbi:MAG: stage V sporulation protein AC [Ruminococcaceae bacterium]|nr:stage V sporulation protein AC [Oscillospiraceae bacterium]
MLPDKKKYNEMTKKASPPSPKLKDFVWAYIVGGAICVIGQLLNELYTVLDLSEKVVKMAVPVSIIFLAALLTGFGIFDKIARRAGAGTLVPITGFANAVVSPAIEFKNEGYILGVGAKIFTIAGPVIMYGTVASVIYGFIYWVTTLF